MKLLKTLIVLFVAFLLVGCGSFVTYSASDQKFIEAATISCNWSFYIIYHEECHVSAVDGLRPGLLETANLSARVVPGHHWVELNHWVNSLSSGYMTSYCAFDYDFAAGHQYKIVAHSTEADIDWIRNHRSNLHAGMIDIKVTRPTGETVAHQIKTTCRFDGGRVLCRESSDCTSGRNTICQMLEGNAFGICTTRP